MLFASVHAYMYSAGATYQHLYRMLIGYQLYFTGCTSCLYLDNALHSQQNKMPEPIPDINKIVRTMDKMMMYINWLGELHDGIGMMVMTLMVLLFVQ